MSKNENETGEPIAKKPRKPRVTKTAKPKSTAPAEIIVHVDPEPSESKPRVEKPTVSEHITHPDPTPAPSERNDRAETAASATHVTAEANPSAPSNALANTAPSAGEQEQRPRHNNNNNNNRRDRFQRRNDSHQNRDGNQNRNNHEGEAGEEGGAVAVSH